MAKMQLIRQRPPEYTSENVAAIRVEKPRSANRTPQRRGSQATTTHRKMGLEAIF